MSSTLKQPEGSASSLRCLLDHCDDVFEQISKNWACVYNGGGGAMTQSSGRGQKFGDRSRSFCHPLYVKLLL